MFDQPGGFTMPGLTLFAFLSGALVLLRERPRLLFTLLLPMGFTLLLPLPLLVRRSLGEGGSPPIPPTPPIPPAY